MGIQQYSLFLQFLEVLKVEYQNCIPLDSIDEYPISKIEIGKNLSHLIINNKVEYKFKLICPNCNSKHIILSNLFRYINKIYTCSNCKKVNQVQFNDIKPFLIII